MYALGIVNAVDVFDDLRILVLAVGQGALHGPLNPVDVRLTLGMCRVRGPEDRIVVGVVKGVGVHGDKVHCTDQGLQVFIVVL